MKHLRGSTLATIHPLAIILAAPLGQCNSLGDYCGPHIASSLFLILVTPLKPSTTTTVEMCVMFTGFSSWPEAMDPWLMTTHPGSWIMMRHVSCILLLEWSTTSQRLWVYGSSFHYAQKDSRFPKSWSLVSTIDGSILPQDCVEEQPCWTLSNW